MKKKLSFLMVAFMAVAAFAVQNSWRADGDEWTIAGSEAILGSSWDTNDTNNNMTSEDGITYTLVKENCTLEAGTTYIYKVVKNHDWANENYGANGELGGKNVELTVDATGIYTVTFTFVNDDSHALSAVAVKTGDAGPVTHTYGIVGDLTGGWENDAQMTQSADDANVYTLTIEGFEAEAKTYSYKLRADGKWGGYELPASGNNSYKFDVAGIYTLVFAANISEHTLALEATKTGDVEEPTYIYAVVGGKKVADGEEADAAIFSGNWDAAGTTDFMTLDEESGKYVWTKEAAKLDPQTIALKVIKKVEGAEDAAAWYPTDNVEIEIPEAGEYNVTVTFDPNAEDLWAQNTVMAVAEKVEEPVITDITISPAEGDIYAALAAAEEGKTVGNISINLTAGVTYTVSAPLVAYGNFEIQANGATIDASELNGNLIEMAATAEVPAEAVNIEYVSIHNATVKGLKKALFYSTQAKYLINWLTIDNCVIEQAADATTIDFTKKSAARNFNIENSTIYAPTATTKSFYSSQSGEKLTELDEEGIQTFIVKNSTMYNLAKGKNFFTHRQNSQKWLAYTVENSLFVNCGKSGQVIKGMNGGGSSTNPTWTINGNAFNFEADGVMTDTSTAEDTGDTTEGEGVQNSVAGVVTFTDAAAGDFNGVFELADGATKPEALGDGSWTLTFKTIPVPSGTYYVMNANAGAVVNAEGAIDAKGAPITFAYDAATKTYTISGADFFAEKQWTVANQYEDMPGYFVITTVVDEATKYLTVDADSKLALADAADDNATWIVLEKAYWEDIMNSTYTVAGTKNLTGTEEDWQIAEANQMKYNEETKLFEITYNNITVTNDVKPEFKVVKTNMNNEQSWYPEGDNSNWVITPDYLGGEGEYDITITFDPSDAKEIKVTGLKIADINITLESGSDIYEALIAAEMSVKPRNITINLVEGGNYTISGPLTAYANFEIQGNGATIDASGLSYNFIQMVTTDNPAVTVPVEYVSIHNATVKGLKKPLFYSIQKGYLINWLTIDNSIIEVAADATTIDFTKGSAARNVNIENSTIYAPVATTKSFYSSQGGQKLTELDEEGIQTFIVKNSTMYNLAKTKNFFTHRQANQKWLAYNVENSLFVNCGKSGQVIKGMNGGQSGTNPTWTITGNAFNFEADGVMTDTSAAEDTGDTTEGEGVQNSVAGVVTFTDAANGDFNGEFQLADGATAPESLGDGRWTITFKGGAEVETTYYLVGTFNNWTASDDYKLTLNENANEGVVEYMLTLDIPANSSMKVLDNIGNWYPATSPNFEVNDEGNFTVYFRPNADGDEFWFEGCIYCQYNGEPSGINTVKADDLKNAEIFNLNGQRVQNAQKGLYIVNGRKVVIK